MAGRQPLLLKCGLSLGDIVALTAAVRDLHLTYPGRFSTRVETSCAEVWEHNPYVTTRRERNTKVVTLDCDLINDANRRPYHYLHAYHQSLSRQLGIALEPREFKGDIHLSEQEKAWNSQVSELAGAEIPFWIISAGGKFDITIKWWSSDRYQQVVDHFRGRIQFVQIGEFGHWHPKLDGVIDLRGKTSIRQLIRLVYHSQGALCGVTGLMHLAAAIETKPGMPRVRPAVVIAGAREPAHWEAYPHHQYIQNVGALPCSSQGGCWRARTDELGDGDAANDAPEGRCLDKRESLPACMDLITAQNVISRVEMYFRGKALAHLNPNELHRAKRAVQASAANHYDDQPLSLSSIGLAATAFIKRLQPSPAPPLKKRGIVIPAGGAKYLTCAWVCISMLRKLGCTLPIELWHREGEIDPQIERAFQQHGVELVNADDVRKKHPMRRFGGWELKPFALARCGFEEALLLDADNVPVKNPEYLFDCGEYRERGAIFWPDYGHDPKAGPLWKALGLTRPAGLEFESGQILVNKCSCWRALEFAVWLNGNSDFVYKHVHGDKETFHLAFQKLDAPFALVPHPIKPLRATMCQHDFKGEKVFQHRNLDKWNLHLLNEHIDGFEFEEECREAVRALRVQWDGGLSGVANKIKPRFLRRRHPDITSVIITTAARRTTLVKTVSSLSQSGWPMEKLAIVRDTERGPDRRARQTATARKALQIASRAGTDYVLFLEDDLAFNQYLFHNVSSWGPLLDGSVTLGSLYNPGLHATACDVKNTCTLVEGSHVFGSQAFIIRRDVIETILKGWDSVEGMQDIRISRLALQSSTLAHYHAPSLVQHVGTISVWGGGFHEAKDFDADWRR